MNNNILIIILSIAVFISCRVKKDLDTDCVLNYEHNTIIGNYNEAKEFYIKKKFLPSMIEELITNKEKKSQIYYEDYYYNTDPNNRYSGYRISGCKDTLWAKNIMAKHLMKKFNIHRFDSIYYDTIYSINLVDESKLSISIEPCEKQGYKINNHYNQSNYINLYCVEWGTICRFILRCGLSRETNSVVYEPRIGLYDVILPVETYKKHGLKEFQKNLLDSLGIDMTQLRVDTIELGVYDYQK